MPRFALLFALLTLIGAAVLTATSSASAAGARDVRFGIGDQHPEMFADPRWEALGLKITRYTIPWDAAGDDGQRERAVAFVRAANAAGVQVLMHITGQVTGGQAEALPSQAAYRREVRRLVAIFRPLGVRTWGAWNEANHSTQPTAHRPDRAAKFFLELRAACAGCTIVAADVLTQGGPRSDGLSSYRGWLRRFFAALGSKRSLAKVIGIHNYGELLLAKGAGISRDLTRFARRYSPRARFWITESGGIASNRSRTCSEARQVVGTTRMFSHAAALAPNGVDRLYLYNWTAEQCRALHDSGLIRADGTARPALATVERGASRFGR
ncbi:MAG: hypothetical protein J7513_05585 [Solirubrobacteraceae bacterium]|nr:hypothetical protein [Solirubrobacteraceae bacterium]